MTEVYYPFGKLFCHPLFTMWLDTIEVGDKWGGHVERVFEIVLRFGLLRRTFVPYLTRGLAEKKALAFLIEHHAIELIDEKGDT